MPLQNLIQDLTKLSLYQLFLTYGQACASARDYELSGDTDNIRYDRLYETQKEVLAEIQRRDKNDRTT